MKKLAIAAFVFLSASIFGQLRISQLPNTNNLASNQLFVVTAGLTNQSISAGQLVNYMNQQMGPSNWLQDFSIIQFGDYQWDLSTANLMDGSNQLYNVSRAITNMIPKYNVKAFVFSGDVWEFTNGNTLAWSNFIERISEWVPVVQSPGNHDRDWLADGSAQISPIAWNTWNSIFPTNWYQSKSWWNGGFEVATNSVVMYLNLTNTPFPVTIIGMKHGSAWTDYNWASNLCYTVLSNRYVILSKHDWIIPLTDEDRLIQDNDPFDLIHYGYTATSPNPIGAWYQSVKYWNPLGFVFSGHIGVGSAGGPPPTKNVARRTLVGEHGQQVHSFSAAYHDAEGTPFFQLHTFLPSQNRIISEPCTTNGIYPSVGNHAQRYRAVWTIREDNAGGLSAQDQISIIGQTERTNWATLKFVTSQATNWGFQAQPAVGALRLSAGTNMAISSNKTVAVFDGTGLKVNSGGATNPVGVYGSLMMNATNIVVCAGAASVYTNVAGTGFTTIVTNGFYGDIAGNSAALTNLVAGWYKCLVNLSYLGAASTTYEGEVFTNNVNCDLISWKNATDNPARIRTSTAAGIIYLPALCRVDFRIQDAGAGSSLSVHRASLVIGTP